VENKEDGGESGYKSWRERKKGDEKREERNRQEQKKGTGRAKKDDRKE